MYNNPYLPQQPQYNKYQPIEQTMPNQYMQPSVQPINYTNNINQKSFLNGKMVESIDMAKNSEISMDGSITYMPLLDKSAIVTKRLTNNGTSEIIVYKPIVEEKEDTIEYLTINDINDLKEEIDNLKQEIKELKNKTKEKSKS